MRRDLHSRFEGEGEGDSLFSASLASSYETEMDLKGKKAVAVLSGGNINAELLFRILQVRMDKGSD